MTKRGIEAELRRIFSEVVSLPNSETFKESKNILNVPIGTWCTDVVSEERVKRLSEDSAFYENRGLVRFSGHNPSIYVTL